MPDEKSEKLEKCVLDPAFAAENWEFLLESVESGDEATMESATESLENCPPLGSESLPRLASFLEWSTFSSMSSQRQYWLVTLIGRYQEQANALQEGIARAACEPSIPISVRERAAWCLGEIGALQPKVRAWVSAHTPNGTERWKRLMDRVLLRDAKAV